MEDIPIVGGFILNSLSNDLNTFIDYSPLYGNNFVTDIQSNLDQVNAILKPVVLTNQMKNSTQALHKAEDDVLAHLNRLEGYTIKAAKKCQLKVSMLKLSDLKKKCHARNAEGVLEGIKTTKQVIAPYLEFLQEAGYTAEKQAELDTLFKTINESNNQQNLYLNQRARLVDDNSVLLNSFYEKLQEIMKDGKIIFSGDKTKIKEYTLSNIQQRVKAARKENGNGEASAGK